MFRPIKKIVKTVLPSGALRRLRKADEWSRLAWHDLRLNVLGDMFPPKPNAISMMVNDICNSHCQMCLIWEQKREKEITPAELEQLLAEPLFSNVNNIGVTGGEPTLRKDIADMFRVIARRRPRIANASMITNAIRGKEVEERVLECSKVCVENGVGFSVMVSLDGLGAVHDTVRGKPGNFVTAIHCIERFKAAGIPVSFGCTITKSNAVYVDELMDWAQENGIYGRFRAAEFIDRLYNARQSDFIRCFSDLESYHLGLFFYRAEHEFEASSMVQKTYRSIRGMLAENKPRATGCPYHHSAVILTSRGELLYCSPKSPNLGSILERGSAEKVFFGNLGKRKEIRAKHCDDCIHDYHVPETFREKVAFYRKSRRIHRRYNCVDLLARTRPIPKAPMNPVDPVTLGSSRVLIVGWYGTETTGDKAILWSVVDRLRRRPVPPREIIVSSLHPFITEWTKREMDLSELRVVETFSSEFESACERADEIVAGGGPLMDLEILNHILFAFSAAARRGQVARVEGCGIGPLQNPLYVEVVGQILRLANHISLRDSKSVERCQRDFGARAVLSDDPAVDYVLKARAELPAPHLSEDALHACCFLREWGADYARGLSGEEFKRMKGALDAGIQKLLAWLALDRGFTLDLLPMHTFSVGGDDRAYNRRLSRQLTRSGIAPNQMRVERLPVSPLGILRSMQRANLNICMRFHSVLFAETLQVPYVAIDYTRGGKIQSFLESRGKLDRLLTLEEVISGQWHARMEALASGPVQC
jgi:MoaA/NifB/PqqE/SkfB family radical SAM enzyme/polysaccharide pyruvyl transferase WcaK-like protein